ncbi:MAG: PQQ-binding-like beta-propeller repeat protein [Planctomycetales bacterium]|nr:PQQ-binding-like beta-propeller repeat protein [Planctomycetales bacterium]
MKALLHLRSAWFKLLVLAIVAVAAGPSGAQVFPPRIGAANPDDPTTIFIAAPRAFRQQLNRAQAAITEERYADAVEALGGILNGETADPDLKSTKGEFADDFFLPAAKPGESQTSLKTQALQMLGAMPEKGRRLYELNYGAEARAMLDASLAEGNVPKLTEVARRYFHTKAGYEAAILLGRLNLDQGRPLAAALAFKRVADVPAAAAQYDPELSILLATSWQFSGQPDKAKETLVALRNRNPNAKIAAGPKPVVLFERDADALDWLTKLVGNGGKSRNANALEWVMFRGNETRTASTNSSLPLLSPRWTVPAVDDPQDATKIRQLAKSPGQRTVIPALQPLVVKDYLIYRTADRVMGVSLQEQGKRVWYFPWDESAYDKATRNTAAQPRNPQNTAREQQLEVRIWKDHAYGEMSSDGNQVFLIDEIGFPHVANNNQMQRVFIGGRGAMFNNPFTQQAWNKLAAIDLSRQGALNWKVGGETGEDDPNLAGAFFLGPPLPLAGQLFVLAEFNGEIRLLCLNAKTGMLEWKQSLAMMSDGRTITMDNIRRLAGATPSFAEGVLVCPTSGEGVAAVDLATRTLRWGYQYPRLDAGTFRRINGFGQIQVADNGNKEHWIDGSVTISGGNVLLTPVEAMDLHCLDLLTGKAKWKLPCEEMLFIGCVHDGKAMLVGKKQIKAIHLADGKEAWAAPIELDSDSPTGRGYYSEHYYYLPTNSSQLLKVDLDQGKIVSQVKTGATLGNLVCYKDELISQSPEGISSYYLAEPLRKRTDELLAKNPDDSWALARRGEILLQDGKQEDALKALRRALVLAPGDAETKGMLARAMLSLLRTDFAAHQALAAEAEPLLADQPTLRRELLRLRAQAMEKAGSPMEAFAAYITLRDQAGDSGTEMEELSRDHSARQERWISARLAALYTRASGQEKKQLDQQIQARLVKAKQAAGTALLADFVESFRFHSLAASGQIEIAQRYVAEDKLLEAELAIGELATHREPTIAGPANAVLATAYEAAKRFEIARERYETLADKFSAVICLNGKTGKDLADAAAQRQNIQQQMATRFWPSGNVEAKVTAPQGANIGFSSYRYQVPISDYRGAASRGLRGQISTSETAFRAIDSSGQLISTTSLSRNNQQFLSSNQASGKVIGHLMLIANGGEILAIDALRMRSGVTTDGMLWRSDMTDGDNTLRRQNVYVSRPANNNPLLGAGIRYTAPIDRGQGTIGAISPLGVTYLRGRQLVCVEPFSGKLLWERSGIESGSDVFGDEHKIVVIPPGEKSDQALVYSAIDGSLLDRRMVDTQDRRWVTCGRNVLAWEAGAGRIVQLRLYDATNQGAGLWSKKVEQPTKGFIIDGEELALLEPSGKFTVVSLKSGAVLVETAVDPEPALQGIAVVASRRQYLLTINQPVTGEVNGVTPFPLNNGNAVGTQVNGKVYALDRATGAAQWQTPAFVSQHALPPDQPTESPVLVFARRKSVSRGGGTTSNVSSLLCLDRRDGSVVYEEDAFLGLASNCDIACNRDLRTVAINMTGDGNRTLTLKFTDNPAPPRPPAQLGMMSSRSLGEQLGTAVDVATDIFRAFNQMPGRNPNGLPPGIRLRLPGGVPVPVQPPK